MENHDVSVPMTQATFLALQEIAACEDSSVGQLIRDAIAKDLRHRRRAAHADRTRMAILPQLQASLADDFAWSNGWIDLQNRLARKGYSLCDTGGELTVSRLGDDRPVCNVVELGFSHARLDIV